MFDAVVDGLGEDEGGEDDGTIGGGDFDVRLVDVDAERYLPQVGIEGRTHGGDGKVGIEVCLAAVGASVEDYLAALAVDVDAVLLTGGVGEPDIAVGCHIDGHIQLVGIGQTSVGLLHEGGGSGERLPGFCNILYLPDDGGLEQWLATIFLKHHFARKSHTAAPWRDGVAAVGLIVHPSDQVTLA